MLLFKTTFYLIILILLGFFGNNKYFILLLSKFSTLNNQCNIIMHFSTDLPNLTEFDQSSSTKTMQVRIA